MKSLAMSFAMVLTACSTPQPMDLVKSIVERDRSTCSCSTTGAGYGCACTPLPECWPIASSEAMKVEKE